MSHIFRNFATRFLIREINRMTISDYNIFTLPNGMRVVHRQTDSHVGYSGVVIRAGSRDEGSGLHGLAHFVEHTIFKGTAHRSSWHINNRLESIGGELNAYTTKEETLLFANTPAGNTERAFELLYDLIAYCNFPHAEIERERDVVIEEINSYLDNPGDSAFDEFEDRIYAGSGLGHNILGTPESVRMLNSEDCRAFIDRLYRPEDMVLYCADPATPSKVEKLAFKHFGRLRHPGSGTERTPVPPAETFSETIDRNGHQAHTLIGTRLFGREDPRSHALFLLNNHIGGPGMSSLLNQELREKRGYVYTVESNVALMSDCGVWTAYFGSDHKTVDKCIRIAAAEIARLADSNLSEAKIERIKRQYIGQMQVASDHRESMAMSMGKSLAYFNEIHDIDCITERIRAVSASDLRSIAETIHPSSWSRLTIC